MASDSSMFPGVDSASKNEYQVNPGGKGGQFVRLTTYHLRMPKSRNLGALTSWNPAGLFTAERSTSGQPLRLLQPSADFSNAVQKSTRPVSIQFGRT
jgi:hypothetical protein